MDSQPENLPTPELLSEKDFDEQRPELKQVRRWYQAHLSDAPSYSLEGVVLTRCAINAYEAYKLMFSYLKNSNHHYRDEFMRQLPSRIVELNPDKVEVVEYFGTE